MVYGEVECSEPCWERKNIRKEANSTDKKEKRRMSEEDSVRSQKLRRNGEKEEKELEKIDDRLTPIAESHNSGDDSDKLPDIKL